jgi:hypothetical protein
VQAVRLDRQQVQLPARRLDEHGDDRQSEPAPLDVLGVRRPPEALGGPLPLLVGQTRSAVGDVDAHPAVVGGDPDDDRGARTRKLDRVVDQRVQRLVQRGRHGAGGERARRSHVPQRHTATGGHRLPRDDPGQRHLTSVDGFQPVLATVRLREREQPIEDLRESVCLLQRELVAFPRLVAGQLGEVLDPQAQRGERVAELVAGVRDERPLPLQHVVDGLDHLVERGAEPAQLGRSLVDRYPHRVVAGRQVMRGRVEDGDRPQRPAAEHPRRRHARRERDQPATEQDEPSDANRARLPLYRRNRHDRTEDLAAAADRHRHHGRVAAPRPDGARVTRRPPGQREVDLAVHLLVGERERGAGADDQLSTLVDHGCRDAVHLVVAGEFEPQRVGVNGAQRGLGERGVAGGVGEPVGDEPLGGAARVRDGERHLQRDKYQHEQDQVAGGQAAAHR